jgi:hypothetical protein
MEAMDFLRLCDCAGSTRLGMIDRGFPQTLARLAGLGYVKQCSDSTSKWPGYKTTKEGEDYIRERHRRERATKRIHRELTETRRES